MTWHRKIPGQAACGPCCGIKEKLQTLWDRTINSILRINQVEPDDQGNIRITSDSEALTVSEGTNEIILDLDTSQLPAAAVTSVNGETGAVQLTGADIPSLYNGTVNSNLAGLWGNKAQQSDLNTEITNRQNADTALQNNINAVQASIPQEAAAAVAADPTVLSFAAAAADIPNKVDKRTGSGLRAYTHDGSTQDDTPVIDGTTSTTIPIRDSNGRLQAADPAAGATDKTLVTANWVSQTGDSAPNNLIHKTGNETYSGNLDVKGTLITPIEGQYLHFTGYYYQHLFDVDIPSGRFLIAGDFVLMTGQLSLTLTIYSNNNVYGNLINLTNDTLYTIFVLKNSITGLFEVWMNNEPRSRISFYPKILRKGNYANLDENIQRITLVNNGSNTDPATDTATYPNGKILLTTYNLIL